MVPALVSILPLPRPSRPAPRLPPEPPPPVSETAPWLTMRLSSPTPSTIGEVARVTVTSAPGPTLMLTAELPAAARTPVVSTPGAVQLTAVPLAGAAFVQAACAVPTKDGKGRSGGNRAAPDRSETASDAFACNRIMHLPLMYYSFSQSRPGCRLRYVIKNVRPPLDSNQRLHKNCDTTCVRQLSPIPKIEREPQDYAWRHRGIIEPRKLVVITVLTIDGETAPTGRGSPAGPALSRSGP